MKVNKAEFTISAVSPAQYPAGDLPEIALSGRSLENLPLSTS